MSNAKSGEVSLGRSGRVRRRSPCTPPSARRSWRCCSSRRRARRGQLSATRFEKLASSFLLRGAVGKLRNSEEVRYERRTAGVGKAEGEELAGGNHRRHRQGRIAVQLRSGGARAPARLQLRRPAVPQEGPRRAHSTGASLGATCDHSSRESPDQPRRRRCSGLRALLFPMAITHPSSAAGHCLGNLSRSIGCPVAAEGERVL